uniref:Uncharacterized protein n=1 Tax=Rhizophora mucronata TaxID=61149 RepID=A0A2P2MEF5_RHIMU
MESELFVFHWKLNPGESHGSYCSHHSRTNHSWALLLGHILHCPSSNQHGTPSRIGHNR